MKYSKDKVINFIYSIIDQDDLVKASISNLKGSYPYNKVSLKPIAIKGELFIQWEQFKDNKAFHSNLTKEQSKINFNELLDNFKQLLINTKDKEIQILKGKNDFNMKIKETSVKQISLDHNKKKNYLLEEGIPVPFLIRLGVMNKDGKVIKEKFSKFRQINKYLEFIEDTLKELEQKKLIQDSIKVVDFGCGKSYLTFALYHYLKNVKNMKLEVIGLDLKKDVINHCNEIAKDLNFDCLEFIEGNIQHFDKLKNVDLIFSLHACNNATDYSILKGLEMNAKAILAVPCCQSEFNQKIHKSETTRLKKELSVIGKHGILQEKFSSLATDALRAQALELCGYKTTVMEFIDMEHTPKNILIKAIKENFKEDTLITKKKEYDTFLKFLGIEPLLDTLIRDFYL